MEPIFRLHLHRTAVAQSAEAPSIRLAQNAAAVPMGHIRR
jgi:hypothetical protein